ncbi:MAG: ABC transporter permease [Planctomycetes bacterium]|nr:ABC transporter permease [Planctomycetota bacterium]
MPKTALIAWREYVASVRTKSFLFGVLLTPLIMGVAFVVPLLFPSEDRYFKIVDGTGRLTPILRVYFDEQVKRAEESGKSSLKKDEGFHLMADDDACFDARGVAGRARLKTAEERLREELKNARKGDAQAIFAFVIIEPDFLHDDAKARSGAAVRYFSRNKAYRDLQRAVETALQAIRGPMRQAAILAREAPLHRRDIERLPVASEPVAPDAGGAPPADRDRGELRFHVLDETGLVLPQVMEMLAVRADDPAPAGDDSGASGDLAARARRLAEALARARLGRWRLDDWKPPRVRNAQSLADWHLWMRGINPADLGNAGAEGGGGAAGDAGNATGRGNGSENGRGVAGDGSDATDAGGGAPGIPPDEASRLFEARARRGEIDAFLHVRAEFLSAAEPSAEALVWRYSDRAGAFGENRALADLLREVLWGIRFSQDIRATNSPVAASSIDPTSERAVSKGEVAGAFVTPFVFVFLLWFGVFGMAQMLLTNVIEEKSNRIVEVLLSSVSPMQIMAGKIVGLGFVGMTLLGIWTAGGYWAAVYNVPAEILEQFLTARTIVYFLVYYVTGYLFLSSILAAIGAACNTLKEAQNLQSVFSLVLVVPMVTILPIAQDPNGTISVAMSYFPFFTPFVMMNRLATSTPPESWEVAATVGVMLVSIAVAFWLAGKIFRIGILMYGNPPRLRDMLAWLRAKE